MYRHFASRSFIGIFGAVALGVLVAAAVGRPDRVDLLLHNGRIAIMDEAFTIHSAIAISGGEVVAVGGEELRRRYQADRVVDLRGRLAIPGFNDTHIHLAGNPPHQIDLSGTRSIRELKAQVAARAREVGPGAWVTGIAWSEDVLEEQRRPLRADLDEAAPDNPVVLTRAGAHSSVANSQALRLAGITRDTRDPEGGIIERDAAGELNGVLRERAMGMVRQLVPPTPREELRSSLVENIRKLTSLGITSFVLAGIAPAAFEEWEEIYRRYGDELPRATVQIRSQDAEELRRFGRKTGDGDDRLRVGALKLLIDGGYTGAAAYTLEAYRGQPGFFGELLIPEPELYPILRAAHDMGWQLGLHTIGDGAIKVTVDVLDRVLRESPRDDHRHYLNHFTVMPPEATLATMARHRIHVAQQPNFVYTLEGRYVEHLEGDRLEFNNPVGELQRRGIFVALSSDILPIDPRVGLYAAVTRRGMTGRVFGARDRISMEEALRGYTASGAFITREEGRKGTLQPGMLADLVVLGENLLTMDPERILSAPIDMTFVGGRLLHERGSH